MNIEEDYIEKTIYRKKYIFKTSHIEKHYIGKTIYRKKPIYESRLVDRINQPTRLVDRITKLTSSKPDRKTQKNGRF